MADGVEEDLQLGRAISVRIPPSTCCLYITLGFSDILKTVGEVLSNK